MKKEYIRTVIEVVNLPNTDVIVCSGDPLQQSSQESTLNSGN